VAKAQQAALFFDDFKTGYKTNWNVGFPWDDPAGVVKPTYLQANPTATPAFNPFVIDANGLTIRAVRSSANGKSYYTGLLTSKMTRLYGYYEFVARMPSSPGAVNGALWIYPTGPSGNAEIDVIEHISNYVMQTVWDGSAHNPTQATNIADATAWHTYSVDYQSDFVTFYIDGKQTFRTMTPANSKTVPMQIVLSVNINDPATDGTVMPAAMTVRSVGIWSNKAAHDVSSPGLTVAQKAAIAAATADMAKTKADYTAMLKALGL
jgi:beta-glucanase (GH16 family)